MGTVSKIIAPLLFLASHAYAADSTLKLPSGEVISVENELDYSRSFLVWDQQRASLLVNRLGQLEEKPTVGIYYTAESVNVDCTSTDDTGASCGKLTIIPFHIGGRKLLSGKVLEQGVIRFQNFSSINFEIRCRNLDTDGSLTFFEDSVKEITCDVLNKKKPKDRWSDRPQYRKDLLNEIKTTGLLDAVVEANASAYQIQQKPDRIDSWSFTFTGFMSPKGFVGFADELVGIKERMHLKGDSNLISALFLPLLFSDSFRSFLFDPCLGRVNELNFSRFCELASDPTYPNNKKIVEQKRKLRRDLVKEYVGMVLSGDEDSLELSETAEGAIHIEAGSNSEPQGRTLKDLTPQALNFKAIKQF